VLIPVPDMLSKPCTVSLTTKLKMTSTQEAAFTQGLISESGPLFYVVLFCVFCLLVVLVRLSVPVQVIDWKDFSPKLSIMC